MLSPSHFNSNKKNPFRKSNFIRSQSTNVGDQSPNTSGSKKGRSDYNTKSRPAKPNLIIEEGIRSKRIYRFNFEGFQLHGPVDDEQKKVEEDFHKFKEEGTNFIQKKNELPQAFEKYILTTDSPFSGIRTTKAKIEPIKPADNIPKTALNPRTSDDIFGIASAKKFMISKKSNYRFSPSQTSL